MNSSVALGHHSFESMSRTRINTDQAFDNRPAIFHDFMINLAAKIDLEVKLFGRTNIENHLSSVRLDASAITSMRISSNTNTIYSHL